MSEGGEDPKIVRLKKTAVKAPGKFMDANEFLKKVSEREEADLQKVHSDIENAVNSSGVDIFDGGRHSSGHGSALQQEAKYKGTDKPRR
jgi:hypothetical protein